MANGNLGELWFQLGLKDNSSKGLQKIIDKLTQGEDKANALLRAMQGFGTKESGFKSQAEKAQKFADILNELNRRITKLYKNDKTDEAKFLQSSIKNALAYLDMLQRINIKQGEISELKSLNPNVDTSKLKEAGAMLENLNKQLLKLQDKPKGRGGGGVDDANVLQGYAKALSMTFRDVKQITDQFKKENPLSVFTGGTAKVEADIARVTEKLAKLRDLMAEGSKKGYNTSMLGGSIIELNGVLSRLQSAHGNKSLLTDAAQMKNLLSDVAVEMTKATAATSAYGREKGKIIAQTKEADAQKRKIEERLNATRSLIELQKQLNHIANQAENGVGMKGLRLGADVTNLSSKIGELRDFANKLGGVNPALMGLGGRKDFTDYKSEAKSLTYALQEAVQAQRELNSAKSAANNKEQRDATKAANEYISALKQLDRETEQAKQRIQSMEKALANLQEKRFTSKRLGLDTTEADAKIAHMKKQLDDLHNILNALNTNGTNSIGLLGNIGNGREVQAANNLASIYDRANKELASTYDKANKEVERGVRLEEQRAQKIAESAAKARNDLANAFGKANEEAGRMNSALSDIKSLFLQGGLVYGAKQFFDSVVQTGGEIVQQHIALRSILGDVQKADELFAQTQQLALESPFKFGELNRDVKQLAAFGVEANDLYDTAKRLADIASGLGVSFERLGLAYGQVKARSWLDGKELRQFAYAGLPLLKMITNLYNQEGKNGKNNYTASDVKGMITKREVSFEDVQKVLWQMTDEGGQFYNMQYVLSDTLLGRWNKLIDAWDIMLGKFADGKGIIGGTFTFILNRVTDLVLALDKLSPAAIAVGGFLAGKAIYSSMSSKMGIGSNLAVLKAEQQAKLRTYAVEQQQLLIEGKITLEKMRQNIADRQGMLNSKIMTRNAVEQAALEGRLSALKLQKAFSEKLILPEMVNQLTAMGLITAKQEEMILNGKRFGLVMQTAAAKLKGAFAAIGGWWTIGIGAVIGTITSIVSDINAVKDKAESLASPSSERMKPYYDILAQDKASNDAELKKQVESMKELLVKSDAYTKTIDDQISKAKGLNEQYDVLKQGVDRAKGIAEGDADLIAGAIGATGGWTGFNPFNDNVTENIEDMRKAMSAYNVRLAAMDDNTKAHLNSIADSYLSAADKTRTLEEKIRILAESGSMNWLHFKTRVNKWNREIGGSMENLRTSAKDVTGAIKEIAEDDVPKIIAYIQRKQGLFGDNFKTWCQNNKSRFHDMLSEILGSANLLVPEINKKLKELTGVTFTGDGKDVTQTPLNSIQRRVFSNLNFNKKQYGLLAPNLVDGSYYESKNKVKTALQGLYNEYQSRLNGGATRQEIASSKADYQALLKAAEKGLGFKFVPEDKKSNKYPKDTTRQKEDKELKALQERLSSLKSAREMYQKYQPYMSDESAKKKTLESFPEVTGLNLDNYQEAIRSLLKGFKTNTTERKKFQTSIYREVAEWLFEENDKKDFEAKAATFSEEMNMLVSRWDTYKSLFEKTGDKDYASNALLDAFVENGKTKKLMDLYEQHYGKRLEHNDLYLSDGEAKKRFKLPNQYEEWKKIVDLLRSNYVQALNDGADAISQTLSTAQKLKSITAKYDKKRTEAGGDDDLKARYDYLEKQEKSGVLFDQLKSQVNWDGVFGNLDNYTKKELRKVRKDLNELIKGGILNGMEPSDIQSFYEGVSKLNNAIDGKSFGGMAELVKELADASKQYDDAVEEYNEALAGGADWQIEAARKKMLAAENQKRTAEGNIKTKKGVNFSNLMTLGNMFVTLGKGDGSGSTLLNNAGGWAESIAKMSGASDKNSSKIGSIIGMFAGLTEAINEKGAAKFLGDAFDDIGGAVNSIFKDFLGINLGLGNADYSDYNDAKAEYENLISVWDTLISKKKQYMSEHWGTEAENASREAIALLESEIEQAKELAKVRLSSGSSAGSHSIWYRMWQGSYDYNGTNWRDVAGEISSKYGVQFNSMEDMVNMSAETLEKIKTDYSGLWAHMDGDFKEYLDKIIEYGDQVDDMTESLTEKLTGNKFSDLISSWGSAMATMANSSDELVEHFEDNLKNAILNSMIENIYGKQIKALMSKTQSYAENNDKLTSSDGSTISEYTSEEYADIISTTEELSEQIEATRDYLQDKYHWSDNSSSSSSSSIKGITESTADVLSSYINAIRADVSVLRQMQGVYLPKIDVTTQAQLQQLTMISENTLRNADAAVAIQASVSDMRDMMNRAQNNTKPFYVYVK